MQEVMNTRHYVMSPLQYLVLYLTLAALVSSGAACSADSEEGPTTELEEINADEIVYGVSRRITQEGVQEALLFADSLFMWRDSAYARVIGLTLIVFDEQGRRRANIEADGGRLSNAGNELTAYGNAVLRIPDTGQEIRTEELNFAPDEDRVWSDLHVVMRESGCVVEGDRERASAADSHRDRETDRDERQFPGQEEIHPRGERSGRAFEARDHCREMCPEGLGGALGSHRVREPDDEAGQRGGYRRRRPARVGHRGEDHPEAARRTEDPEEQQKEPRGGERREGAADPPEYRCEAARQPEGAPRGFEGALAVRVGHAAREGPGDPLGLLFKRVLRQGV